MISTTQNSRLNSPPLESNDISELSDLPKPKAEHLRPLLQRLQIPILIGIAGDSGSGKTTYSHSLRQLIGSDLVSIISMDRYSKDCHPKGDRPESGPLDPSSRDLPLLAEHLSQLKRGEAIALPVPDNTKQPFLPKPIVIVEGLHALYPELQDHLDFSVYIDPEYHLKWRWNFDRHLERGRNSEEIEQELLMREVAFKKWIDFQKSSATVVVKLYQSRLEEFAKPRFIDRLPDGSCKVELIVEPAPAPLPHLSLPLNLGAILEMKQPSFMLVAVASTFWGRKVLRVHLDGVFPPESIAQIQHQIMQVTGLPPSREPDLIGADPICADELAKMLVIWRFLEQVNDLIHQRMKSGQLLLRATPL
jgi:phosphoribulokinase